MGNIENDDSQDNDKFFPSFEFNRTKRSFCFNSSSEIDNCLQQKLAEIASQNQNDIDQEQTKSKTVQNNEINKGKKLVSDNDTNNFNYIKSPQVEHIQTNSEKIFEIRKIKGGRGRKKNKNKFHNSYEIGNATKKYMISFINELDEIARTLAKNSNNFKNLRLKKLYKPTITKVTKFRNNTKDDIGIFASHTKMRDLINSKLVTVFTDYTFPKRVIGDINLSSIKDDDYKIKKRRNYCKIIKSI